jgi:membrane protein DedA with SNARE-associated domain
MGDLEQLVTDFITAHQAWAGPTVFALAFGESLAFIGFLLPATAALVLVGVLIGQDLLDFWLMAAWAIPGAALGDIVSFWIGRYFRDSIRGLWPFTRHKQALDYGHRFFARWGVASVFLGRFLGPVRAVIPLIAGMMDMPKLKFQIANWSSAALWAPYWLCVGLFGERLFAVLLDKVPWWTALAIVAAAALVAYLVWLRIAKRGTAPRH